MTRFYPSKVVSAATLQKKLEVLRRQKMRIVFTNGCFDILHAGHVRYLTEAKKCGDVLVIGLNSDQSVRRLKGKDRPVQHQKDRALVLAAMACVDFVCLFNEDTPLKLIQKAKPAVLVKGGDWKIQQIVGSDFVQKSGGNVRALPYYKGYSTTGLIEKIQKLG